MKRNIIFVLLILLALGGTLLAREKMVLKVKVQSGNVRSAPEAAAEVIAKVTAGTLLEASGRDGSWYEVTVNNASGKEVSGYIHNSIVEVLAGDEEEEAAPRPRAAARRPEPSYRSPKAMARGGAKLMGGLSMGNLNLSETLPPEIKKTAKMDFMGGLGFESGGKIAFELDLLYSPGGAVLKSTDPAEKGKITISGTAITLPIMLKVRFLQGTTPYILAGGEVGYILNQKFVATASDGTKTEEDITDDVNRLVYGLVFGGGVELQAGSLNLLLEARYRLGLSNQIKEPDPGEYLKTTALTFLLGVKF
jgi:hypothetical protein